MENEMKRIFLVLALMLCVGMAFGQSYTKNPTYGIGGETFKYGMKAHPVSIVLVEYDKTVNGGDTTAAMIKANKRFSFVAPFTCLIDSFWMCYSGIVAADTIAAADTLAGYIVKVFTGGGAGTAPATEAFRCSTVTSISAGHNTATTTALQLATRMKPNTVYRGNTHATITNRYLTAGELYSIVIDTIGAGHTIAGGPRRLIAGWNLVAPNK
jgi:hypothetical protein